MPNESRAIKKMLGSPSRSTEIRRVVEKRSPMLFTRASLSVKQEIGFSSAISSLLGA